MPFVPRDSKEISKQIERCVSNAVPIGNSTIYDIKKIKNKILKFKALCEPYNIIAERKSLPKPKLENPNKVLH